MSLFDALQPATQDPILLSFQDFMADPRAEKTNLGVGMYYDAQGRIPVMRAVAAAEEQVMQRQAPWGYLMSEGLPGLRAGAESLLFGDALAGSLRGRVATLQTLGGTGAIRLGAEVINRLQPGAVVAMSRPTWLNHPSTFQAAGLQVAEYPYYDRATGEVEWAAMREAVAAMPAGTVVLLHACCHNPTGADLSPGQWAELADLLAERRLVPFLDLAYGGFGDGLEADTAPVRLLAAKGLPLFVATSFSKSFALYGERVGALSVVAESAEQATMLTETMKSITRNIYSTPPTHGALLVATVLGDPVLRADWRAELESMRLRIVGTRQALLDRVGRNSGHDFGFLTRQKGLFSYSGLSVAQMQRMKAEAAVHAVEDGRICMAAVNESNIDRVAAALRAVTQEG
ncbi:aromatic amino acid transaminase [Roseomonas sp. BN140053]|uniref:amino acid aminotransferase n=1 Tax=Roseomonas sp. BN140053 TaxID=3391898 RepID=UPI0039EA4D7E